MLAHTLALPNATNELLAESSAPGFVDLSAVQCIHSPATGQAPTTERSAHPTPERWEYRVSDTALQTDIPLGLDTDPFYKLGIYTKDGSTQEWGVLTSCDDMARWEAESTDGKLAVTVTHTVYRTARERGGSCLEQLVYETRAALGGGLFLATGDQVALSERAGACGFPLERTETGVGRFDMPLSLKCRADGDGQRLELRTHNEAAPKSPLVVHGTLRADRTFATAAQCEAERERLLGRSSRGFETFPIEQTVTRTTRPLTKPTDTVQRSLRAAVHGVSFVGLDHVDLRIAE